MELVKSIPNTIPCWSLSDPEVRQRQTRKNTDDALKSIGGKASVFNSNILIRNDGNNLISQHLDFILRENISYIYHFITSLGVSNLLNSFAEHLLTSTRYVMQVDSLWWGQATCKNNLNITCSCKATSFKTTLTLKVKFACFHASLT